VSLGGRVIVLDDSDEARERALRELDDHLDMHRAQMAVMDRLLDYAPAGTVDVPEGFIA
jgi:hypothetical protein